MPAGFNNYNCFSGRSSYQETGKDSPAQLRWIFNTEGEEEGIFHFNFLILF